MKPPVAGSCSECRSAKACCRSGSSGADSRRAERRDHRTGHVGVGRCAGRGVPGPAAIGVLMGAQVLDDPPQNRLRRSGLAQRQHSEDVVVEQSRFTDLGAVEQFGDAGDQVALGRVARGREPRGLDAAGDPGEDSARRVGAGTAGTRRLPFVQVEILGTWVGERGVDVCRVDVGGRQGGHCPVAAEAAALFLVGLEPVGAAVGGMLRLGGRYVGTGVGGPCEQGRDADPQRAERAQGPSGGDSLWRIHRHLLFQGRRRTRTTVSSEPAA